VARDAAGVEHLIRDERGRAEGGEVAITIVHHFDRGEDMLDRARDHVARMHARRNGVAQADPDLALHARPHVIRVTERAVASVQPRTRGEAGAGMREAEIGLHRLRRRADLPARRRVLPHRAGEGRAAGRRRHAGRPGRSAGGSARARRSRRAARISATASVIPRPLPRRAPVPAPASRRPEGAATDRCRAAGCHHGRHRVPRELIQCDRRRRPDVEALDARRHRQAHELVAGLALEAPQPAPLAAEHERGAPAGGPPLRLRLREAAPRLAREAHDPGASLLQVPDGAGEVHLPAPPARPPARRTRHGRARRSRAARGGPAGPPPPPRRPRRSGGCPDVPRIRHLVQQQHGPGEAASASSSATFGSGSASSATP
jgi:hypothetical protein